MLNLLLLLREYGIYLIKFHYYTRQWQIQDVWKGGGEWPKATRVVRREERVSPLH